MRLLLAATLALTAGCVGLPEDGPVVVSEEPGLEDAGPGVSYVPRPPQPGESPRGIVRSFLDALTAVPLQPSLARAFLTREEQDAWDPDRGILTYDESGAPTGTTEVSVGLSGAKRLDGRGRWRGAAGSGDAELRFPLVREDGEWRIADAPDALVVPETWFAEQFRRVNRYFFDPTAQVLVPEPAWLPRGEQLATDLVRGLVAGPGRALRGVARTFLPPGSVVELSVVVSDDGVAGVSLQGDSADLSPAARGLALAQLAWTLRQDPGVRALRLSIGGEPVSAPNGPSEISVDAYADADPTLLAASHQLFGLRDERVVVASPEAVEQVGGPLGTGEYALRDLAVNLTATRVAGVSRDRSAVWVGPMAAADDARVLTHGGRDLLRPAWDHAGRLWLVDRTRSGARVSVVQGGGRRSLRARGVTGGDVRQMLISRDGSRLVTVLRRPVARGGDVVRVSRVRVDPGSGRVLSVTAPQELGPEGEPMQIRDIGWSSATEVVAVNRLGGELTELRTLAVDGSPASLDEDGSSDLLRERVLGIASSPVPSERTYVRTPNRVLSPVAPDQAVGPFPEDLSAISYVG